MHLPIFFHVFVISVAATATSCSSERPSFPADSPGSKPLPEGQFVSICLSAPGGIRILDVFIYRDTLTKPLEKHIRLEAPVPEVLRISSRPGDRFAVIIANSPAPFNLRALQSMDSAEQLEMYYREEDPVFPLMSCVCSIGEEGEADAVLSPLLCPVRILSVENSTGSPLSGLRLSLTGVNSHVQMLRTDGFRTVESEDSPSCVAHPEMMQRHIPGTLGEEAIYPDMVLYCYPFDGEGPLQTELHLSAMSRDGPQEWVFAIGPLRRGDSCSARLHI